MTMSFLEEARAYREKKAREVRRAAMRAAFFLSTGIEIDAALALEGDARAKLRQRLGRLIERERLRGAARHWSYDLNRRRPATGDAKEKRRHRAAPPFRSCETVRSGQRVVLRLRPRPIFLASWERAAA
jgi:hypothetical protein